MGIMAVLHTHLGENVVPLRTKEELRHDRVCDVLRTIAPRVIARGGITPHGSETAMDPAARAGAIRWGADIILQSLKPAPCAVRADTSCPLAWQTPGGSRARLDEYGRAPEFKAGVLGAPVEWHRAILLECAVVFCKFDQPTSDEMQRAALFLFDRTTGKYTSPDKVWFALAVLLVPYRLTGKLLTAYQQKGGPGGTALAYVRDMLKATGKPGMVSRWPAEFVEANRLLRDRLPAG